MPSVVLRLECAGAGLLEPVALLGVEDNHLGTIVGLGQIGLGQNEPVRPESEGRVGRRGVFHKLLAIRYVDAAMGGLKVRPLLFDRTGRLIRAAASQILANATSGVGKQIVIADVAVRTGGGHGRSPYSDQSAARQVARQRREG